VDNIFALGAETNVLVEKDGSARIAARDFAKGRAVYLSGFKVAPQNTRLIHRAIFWAAQHEEDFAKWTSSNPHTECAWYAASRKLVVINNSGVAQTTTIFDAEKKSHEVELEAHGIRIIEL